MVASVGPCLRGLVKSWSTMSSGADWLLLVYLMLGAGRHLASFSPLPQSLHF